MEIKSVRAKIRSIAEDWRKCYCNPPREDHFINQRHVTQIYKELAALDVETATAADVNKITGNGSWTRNVCDECGFSANVLIQLGEEPDYESPTANICYGCLCEAVNLLGKEIDTMTKKIDNRREAGDMNFLVGRLGSIAPTIRVTGGSLATMVGRRVQECNATDLTYYGKQLAFITNDLNKVLAKLANDANEAKVKAVKLAMYLKFVRKLEKDANKKAPKTSADNG